MIKMLETERTILGGWRIDEIDDFYEYVEKLM